MRRHVQLGLMTLLAGSSVLLVGAGQYQSSYQLDNKLFNWWTGSHTVAPYGYDVFVAPDIKYEGKPVARISSTKEDQSKDYYVHLHRDFQAKNYRGKRVELSCEAEGKLKTGEANLVVIVRDEDKPIAFDCMKDRTMKLDNNWSKQSVVVDVPADSTKITVGFTLKGGGTLNIADLQFHAVNSDVALTSTGPIDLQACAKFSADLPTAPRNFDFSDVGTERGPKQITSWMMLIGDAKHPDYDMVRDDQKVLNGQSSATIISIKDKPESFAVICQDVNAQDYRGKKMKFSAQVQCADVKDWAGLWLRVDSVDQVLAFDNMENRPLKGSFDWRPESIVVDIPAKAKKIRLGFMQAGAGQSWYSNSSFKPASSTDATTADVQHVAEIHMERLPENPNLDIRSK